jgi:hypothetical protein
MFLMSLSTQVMDEIYVILISYTLVVVTSSGILKAKQKLAVTFHSDEHDIIDFIKFSKMTMCRASEAIS